MPLSDQPSDGGLSTVRHLLDSIGAPILKALAAPGALDRPVRGTVLHDPADPLPPGRDQVLLMPGLLADQRAAAELVEAAARLGYSAMIVKLRGADGADLVDEAARCG